MTHSTVLAAFAVALVACSRPAPAPESSAASLSSSPVASASAVAPSAPSAASPAGSTPSTPSTAPAKTSLRAEIVPVIGGLFPVAKADPAGVPVPTTLVLRVTNDGDAPVFLRTGGDDEGFELTIRGTGVVSNTSKAPCNELWAFGKKNTIAPHGTLDVPLQTFASGARCKQTAHYLTAPGLYEIEVGLRAHVHADAGPSGKGERGTEVLLVAPKITVRAG
jgi:hypothetical protein